MCRRPASSWAGETEPTVTCPQFPGTAFTPRGQDGTARFTLTLPGPNSDLHPGGTQDVTVNINNDYSHKILMPCADIAVTPLLNEFPIGSKC